MSFESETEAIAYAEKVLEGSMYYETGDKIERAFFADEQSMHKILASNFKLSACCCLAQLELSLLGLICCGPCFISRANLSKQKEKIKIRRNFAAVSKEGIYLIQKAFNDEIKCWGVVPISQIGEDTEIDHVTFFSFSEMPEFMSSSLGPFTYQHQNKLWFKRAGHDPVSFYTSDGPEAQRYMSSRAEAFRPSDMTPQLRMTHGMRQRADVMKRMGAVSAMGMQNLAAFQNGAAAGMPNMGFQNGMTGGFPNMAGFENGAGVGGSNMAGSLGPNSGM